MRLVILEDDRRREQGHMKLNSDFSVSHPPTVPNKCQPSKCQSVVTVLVCPCATLPPYLHVICQ